MALSGADKEALNLLVNEFGVVSTWHTGAREAKINELVEKLRLVADGNASAVVEEQKAAEAAAAEAAAAAGNPQEQPTE